MERPENSRSSNAGAESIDVPCRGDRTVCLDTAALRDAGLAAPLSEQRQIAAELRIIKRPILAAMTGGNPLPLGNVIVVTSALPGEGKTFMAINLALSLALERDRKVILVDGDVAKAHVTSLFELKGERGLLDLSGAGCGLEETIVQTDNPALYVLPTGNKNTEATEILRSDRTWSLLTVLASDPRIIFLIDAPPLLVTSEASVVVSNAGQVLVIVKAAETPQEAVLRAISIVPDEKPVSLVLNQAEPAHMHRYGYYGPRDYGEVDTAPAKGGHNPIKN